MGMKLKAKAMCLGCEQKSSDKGVYFIVTLGGIGFGCKFFTKSMVIPSDKMQDFDFEYDNGKLNLLLPDVK